MGEVKRYDPMGYDKLSGYMQQHPDGDYVHHDDYATLEAELARMKGEYEWVASINTALDESNQSAWAENAKLRAELERLAPEVTKELASLAWQRAYAEGDDSGIDMSLRVARQVAALLRAPSAPKADDPVKVKGDALTGEYHADVNRLMGVNQQLLEALEKIAAIEDQEFGADWEEIEEARNIAEAAIAAARQEVGKV